MTLRLVEQSSFTTHRCFIIYFFLFLCLIRSPLGRLNIPQIFVFIYIHVLFWYRYICCILQWRYSKCSPRETLRGINCPFLQIAACGTIVSQGSDISRPSLPHSPFRSQNRNSPASENTNNHACHLVCLNPICSHRQNIKSVGMIIICYQHLHSLCQPSPELKKSSILNGRLFFHCYITVTST